MAKRSATPVLDALGAVDWPRMIHRGAALVRALRGDSGAAADQAFEDARAVRLKGTINAVVRGAVGCQLPNVCDCPFCSEGKP
jgi:hypothetical protein